VKQPLLSICLRTYNNQEFIIEALEGILKQKVNFDLELIYSDDCSEDNSFQLVKDAIKNSSQFVNVHLIKQPENFGWTNNFWYVINNAKGDYIALCDGDDYWSDPNKLQYQVAFLRANPDYQVCFTNVCTVNENSEIIKEKMLEDHRREDYKMKHLPALAPVSSRVFRNRDFTSLSKTVPGEEVYLLLYQSIFGKIKFLNKVTGAYRYRSGSVYSSQEIAIRKDFILKTHMECMDLVTKNLYAKYQNLIVKKIVELRYLNKELYLERLLYLKSFMKKYPDRFSTWESIKINVIVGIMRVLDLVGVHGGESLMLRIINKTI
jgi:glycosyltransferase involved in cell wall biosynthesis